MEARKVDSVCTWKEPCNVRGIREFIGFCNVYHWFIKGFANVAQPLHDLTKKDQKWSWDKAEQWAFDQLKKAICETPVLKNVDTIQKFCMETDASNYAYSAILSQMADDRMYHPIAFFSKSMNPAEQIYGISDKEALAIVKALQHWCHWLENTKQPMEIITDHQNLEYFKNP
jgi:hypothetical protein